MLCLLPFDDKFFTEEDDFIGVGFFLLPPGVVFLIDIGAPERSSALPDPLSPLFRCNLEGDAPFTPIKGSWSDDGGPPG